MTTTTRASDMPKCLVALLALLATLFPALDATSLPPADLTDLCCEISVRARLSEHAILAHTADRTLAPLYKTAAYEQMLVETYCMSVSEPNQHPRCNGGQCRQVKEPQDAIVVDEHGRRRIRPVLVNSGCVFVPSSA